MLRLAKQSVLFGTPIVHYLVRTFLADGVDEFLAHITTIEAALGCVPTIRSSSASRLTGTKACAR